MFPFFVGGAASPWDDALDLLVAGAMIRLLGWHWAFLPTFFAELIPGLDLVPTWTAAVFFTTRGNPRPSGDSPAIEAEVISGGKGSAEREDGELRVPGPGPETLDS